EPGRLVREAFSFPDIDEGEVLAEPIYGCFGGNMAHAIKRKPIDICHARAEPKVVLGNSGVIRVLRTGPSVRKVREGDLCLVFGCSVEDRNGYTQKTYAFEAPGTVGLLAKRTKLHENELIPLPSNSVHPIEKWAAFNVRHITAWANWKMALGCYRVLQSDNAECPTQVWGWGGGTTLAELQLAKQSGCEAWMMSANPERLRMICAAGVRPVDRRPFADLNFEE